MPSLPKIKPNTRRLRKSEVNSIERLALEVMARYEQGLPINESEFVILDEMRDCLKAAIVDLSLPDNLASVMPLFSRR